MNTPLALFLAASIFSLANNAYANEDEMILSTESPSDTHKQQAEAQRALDILEGNAPVTISAPVAELETPLTVSPTEKIMLTPSVQTQSKQIEQQSTVTEQATVENLDEAVLESAPQVTLEEKAAEPSSEPMGSFTIKTEIQEPIIVVESEPTVTRKPFETKNTKKADIVYDYISYEAQTSDWAQTTPNPYTYNEPWLLVGVRTQSMKHFDSWGRLLKEYPISTAKRGVGELENSYQTPRGHHKICERIGDGLPAREIFSRRIPTGSQYSRELRAQYPTKDWILTRIMWLCGQEEGKNKGYNSRGQVVDSYRRYIYIHGAGDHAPFGASPSSLGCVRMISEDVIEIFNKSKIGTDVYIDQFK